MCTQLYTTFQQRQLFSSSQPRFFMELDQVQVMCRQLGGAIERINILIAGTHPMFQQQSNQIPPRQLQPMTVPSQNIASSSTQAPPANRYHFPPHFQTQTEPLQSQWGTLPTRYNPRDTGGMDYGTGSTHATTNSPGGNSFEDEDPLEEIARPVSSLADMKPQSFTSNRP